MSFFGLNEPIFPGHERLTIGAAPLMFFIWRFVCDCRHFCWKPRAGCLSSRWKGRVTAHLDAKQGEVRERKRDIGRVKERWHTPFLPQTIPHQLIFPKTSSSSSSESTHTHTHQDIKQAHWFGVYNYQMAGSLKGTPVRVHVCACVCRWRGLINMSLTKGDADQRGSRWARCVCAVPFNIILCRHPTLTNISHVTEREREREKRSVKAKIKIIKHLLSIDTNLNYL